MFGINIVYIYSTGLRFNLTFFKNPNLPIQPWAWCDSWCLQSKRDWVLLRYYGKWVVCPLCPLCLFNFHVRFFFLWLNMDRQKLITLTKWWDETPFGAAWWLRLCLLCLSVWGLLWVRLAEQNSGSSFRPAPRWCAGASDRAAALLRQRAIEFRA